MKLNQDSVLGLFFVVIGVVAVSIAASYSFGTAGRMGPGFFPVIVSGLLVVTGLAVLARSLAGSADQLQGIAWKQLLLVSGAVLIFALSIERLGLPVAILLLLFVSGATSVKFRLDWKASLGAAIFAAVCTVVFINLLGLPIPILGSWLQRFWA